jgi:hypothetical protein
MEREKLIWGPAFYGDGGNPGTDLGNAASHNYKFAWEYQWDYNPALSQPKSPAYEYVNTCQNYPYPSLEPGCSNSAPESPQTCTWTTVGGLVIRVCGFTPAVLSGGRSPYMATAPSQIWNPSNPALSFANIILSLSFNNAVVLGFNVSDNFKNDAPGGYVYYDPADIADKKNYHGSHVVHVVGFVSNSDLAANPATQFAPAGAGGGYLIIKNSWGACSGDAGYMYMPVSYFEATANGVYVVSSETH